MSSRRHPICPLPHRLPSSDAPRSFISPRLLNLDRFGVRVGMGWRRMDDAIMRDLYIARLEFDEIWSFVGKKQKHAKPEELPGCCPHWANRPGLSDGE
jgi:hypothetical protein